MTSRVLMCLPTQFGVNYSINPWMDDNIGKVDFLLAIEQWSALYKAIKEVAKVELIEPAAGLPDMVFTANAGKVKSNTFYPSLFHFAERRAEQPIWVKYFTDKQYNILWPSDHFEGEGDYLEDSLGISWGGYGFRSAKNAVFSAFNLELKDPRFYHLDTCFCPLPNQGLLWYPDAFNAPPMHDINFSFKKIINVSEEDALTFACNAVVLGNNIFLPKNKNVTPQLQAMGYEVREFDMSEFIKSGGACKCLVLNLD